MIRRMESAVHLPTSYGPSTFPICKEALFGFLFLFPETCQCARRLRNTLSAVIRCGYTNSASLDEGTALAAHKPRKTAVNGDSGRAFPTESPRKIQLVIHPAYRAKCAARPLPLMDARRDVRSSG